VTVIEGSYKQDIHTDDDIFTTDYRVKVYLLSNCPLRRAGLESICEHKVAFDIVGIESSFPESIDACREVQPDLIIIDQALFSSDQMQEAPTKLHPLHQISHVIVLADQLDLAFACSTIADGTKGYILVSSSMEEIFHALYVVALGGIWLEQEVMHALATYAITANQQNPENEHASRSLSEREIQILRGIARGQTTREIASRLCLSESSVRTYWYRVLNKLNAINKAEAIVIASQMGLLESFPGSH
jgi:DNA-binding NarL/FixJ family response regulator